METGPPPWSADCAETVALSLTSTNDAPRDGRRAVERLVGVLPAGVIADLRTIVSELITNSVLHGTGQDIDLLVEVALSGRVCGSVSDGGLAPVLIGPPRRVGDGGLGLRIVDALASRWGVDAPLSAVWFELAVPASRSAPTNAGRLRSM